MRRGERARGKQQRRAGDGNAELLGEDPEKDDPVAVFDEEVERDGHRGRPAKRSFSIDVAGGKRARRDST